MSDALLAPDRIAIDRGRDAFPAAKGAGEVAGIGEAEEVGNLADPVAGVFHVAVGQIAAGFLQQCPVAGVPFLQLALQAALAHVQVCGDALLADSTGGQFFGDGHLDAGNDVRLIHARDVVVDDFFVDARQLGIAGRQPGFDGFGVEAQGEFVGAIDDGCLMKGGQLVVAGGIGIGQVDFAGMEGIAVTHPGHAHGDGKGQIHGHGMHDAFHLAQEGAEDQSIAAVFTLETQLPRVADDAHVAHQPLEGFLQGLAGQPGITQGVEGGGVPVPGCREAKTGIAGFLHGAMIEAVDAAVVIAGIGIVEQGRIEPGLAQQGVRIDAFLFEGLDHHQWPGGQRGAVHGPPVIGNGTGPA